MKHPTFDSLKTSCFTGQARLSDSDVDLPSVRWTRDNIWFPHQDLTEQVSRKKPDLLFFSGDQVYEGNSPTRAVKQPESEAKLDYLYKWYLWVWAFRDLTRDIPAITIPDDHDVFQGNIWGMAGASPPTGNLQEGGYVMTPEFVNMVQRTQTSHLPDAYDPTPVSRSIQVYYTALSYGGISFAIIEDRKFKSEPIMVRDVMHYQSGAIMDKNYDPKRADVKGAVLLGDRQLKFLRDWAGDWRGVVMKAALSQTNFANLQIDNGRLVPDLDSGGWPQSGRDRAVLELRRAHAIHIAGDQHLGSVLRYGIEEWSDSNYSFCVPSIANFHIRRWTPDAPGRNRKPGMPAYTGEYLDGLGNKVTVYAVANPKLLEELTEKDRRQPQLELHRKAPGYGIVRFHKEDRKMTIECWPRKPDSSGVAAQYPGWPITIDVTDNYGRQAKAFLPTLRVSGVADPVVQVIDESSGEIVYTLRIKGRTFRPRVFHSGFYTVRVGEPGTERMKTITRLQSVAAGEERAIDIGI